MGPDQPSCADRGSPMPRLAACPLVFVDVETTGLSPWQGDRICEIAIIRRESDGRRREWSSLVDPLRSLSPGAFAVNRITTEMLSGAPRFPELVSRFASLIADGVWVAHNAAFDLGFLRSEFARAQAEFPSLPVIDTVAVARRYFRFPSNRLGALAAHFGIANPQEHRALGDCRAMENVFLAMIDQAFGGRDPSLSELNVQEAEPTGSVAGPVGNSLPASLAEIINQNRRLQIVYVSAGGQKTTRPIAVRDVTGTGDSLCLVADCGLRGEVRYFRLDRIIDWKPLNDE